MSTKALMTVEQFAQMRTADTEDYELVEGELIPLSSGTPRHAEIRDLTGDLIRSYFRSNRLGKVYAEIDCLLQDDEVRRPDLSIFLNDRLSLIDLDRIPAPIAPDIAVEVLSPSEGAIDLRHKVRDYLRGGSREVWLLDHSNGEIQVITTAGIRILAGSDVLESPLLPGFTVTADEFLLNPAS
jgi:Uma2 family endonuclease